MLSARHNDPFWTALERRLDELLLGPRLIIRISEEELEPAFRQHPHYTVHGVGKVELFTEGISAAMKLERFEERVPAVWSST